MDKFYCKLGLWGNFGWVYGSCEVCFVKWSLWRLLWSLLFSCIAS